MAFLFSDSFDHYATGTGDLLKKWTEYSGATIDASGRHGQCMLVSNSLSRVTKSVAASGATAIFGFAYKRSASSYPSSVWNLLLTGSYQCSFLIGETGFGLFKRGYSQSGTTLGYTNTGNPTIAGVWAFLEFKIVLNTTTGSVVVKKDGVEWMNLTNVNTQNAGSAGWDALRFCEGINDGGMSNRFDDLYICDGSGSVNNDFLGEIRVDSHLASANGSNNGSTPSTGTDRYATVDEASINDTDYNILGPTGLPLKDTLNFPSLIPAGGTIKAVQVNLGCMKTDSGAATVNPVVRHSGVDYDGGNQNPSTSYLFLHTPYDQNPGAGPGAWTETDFNNAEFGYKRTA